MIERTTNQDLVVAVSMWVGVGSLFAIAAALMALGHWRASLLVGEMSCAFSAGAAVRHIRCYAIRICELTRRVRGGSDGEESEQPSLPLQRVH